LNELHDARDRIDAAIEAMEQELRDHASDPAGGNHHDDDHDPAL
jgi:hypothetical protein